MGAKTGSKDGEATYIQSPILKLDLGLGGLLEIV